MDVFIIGALDIKCSKLDLGTDKEFKSMGHSWVKHYVAMDVRL